MSGAASPRLCSGTYDLSHVLERCSHGLVSASARWMMCPSSPSAFG
jgi:hypothetical protein